MSDVDVCGTYRGCEERLRVYAPIVGEGSVSTGYCDVLSVSASHVTVVGRNNYVDLAYRYRFEKVEVTRDAGLAIRDAFQDWAAGRDPTQAVQLGEYTAYRRHLQRRLHAYGVPPGRGPRLFDGPIVAPRKIEISDSPGVVIGDHNWITSTEDIVIPGAGIDMLALVLYDTALVRAIFLGLQSADPGRAIRQAVGAATRSLSSAELVSNLSVAGGLTITHGTAAVDGVAVTMVGSGHASTSHSVSIGHVGLRGEHSVVQPRRRIARTDCHALLDAVEVTVARLHGRILREVLRLGPTALPWDEVERLLATEIHTALAAIVRRLGLPEGAFAAGCDARIEGWDPEQIDDLRRRLAAARRKARRQLHAGYREACDISAHTPQYLAGPDADRMIRLAFGRFDAGRPPRTDDRIGTPPAPSRSGEPAARHTDVCPRSTVAPGREESHIPLVWTPQQVATPAAPESPYGARVRPVRRDAVPDDRETSRDARVRAPGRISPPAVVKTSRELPALRRDTSLSGTEAHREASARVPQPGAPAQTPRPRPTSPPAAALPDLTARPVDAGGMPAERNDLKLPPLTVTHATPPGPRRLTQPPLPAAAEPAPPELKARPRLQLPTPATDRAGAADIDRTVQRGAAPLLLLPPDAITALPPAPEPPERGTRTDLTPPDAGIDLPGF